MQKKKKIISELSGKITRLFFQSDGFSAGQIKDENGKIISFSIKARTTINEIILLKGSWTTHKKYGEQFEAVSFEYIQPVDEDGLCAYISHNPNFTGIGPVKGRELARILADTDAEKITKDNQALIEKIVSQVPLSYPHTINFLTIWDSERTTNQVSQMLAKHDLTHNQIQKVVSLYGNSSLDVLKNNPYVLITDLQGVGFRVADKIAIKLKFDKQNPKRIQAGILYVFKLAENEGHTMLEYKFFIKSCVDLLTLDTLESNKAIIEQVKNMIKPTQTRPALLYSEKINNVRYISSFEMRRTEEYLFDIFKTNSQPNSILNPLSVACDLEQCCGGMELTTGQQKAVENVFNYHFSLCVGGAGTGKTTIIKTIVQIARLHGLSVELAAPTGKAAKRMQNVVGHHARTIHRLLEFAPQGGGFLKHSGNPIESDIVIIDEASMLDVHLCKSLICAIDFEKTAVLFVGDHNQLQPVGAGNVLRDLIKASTIHTSKLDKVLRQAGTLKKNCMQILDGVLPETETDYDIIPPWTIQSTGTDEQIIIKILLLMIRDNMKKYKLDAIEDLQILSPMRKGVLGCVELNKTIQKFVQFNLYGVEVEDTKAKRFYKNDKVIQTRNNYETNIMNGTCGRVVNVSNYGKKVEIQFENEIKTITIESGDTGWNDIDLAYALTVHKSQGSEFPYIIFIVAKQHTFMHNRSLFYTAVTRSRLGCVCLGSKRTMNAAVEKQVVAHRQTWLSKLLK